MYKRFGNRPATFSKQIKKIETEAKVAYFYK